MKRRITLSIALALSVVLVSLTSSDSTANQQSPQRFKFDTGLIIPGPHQKLRLTVNRGAENDAVNVRFRRMEYMQGICSGGVCKHTVAFQTLSNAITLMPDEAAIHDIFDGSSNTLFGDGSVRGVVESNRRDVRVTATIINAFTGEVTCHIILANTEGDFH